MKIKPIHDYLLVQRDTVENVTAGGIALPDTDKRKSTTGTVLAVGPGLKSEKTGRHLPMECEVGDRVCFDWEDGTTIKLDGGNVFLVNESRSYLCKMEK